ncbi:sporulation integral membrane protein YtvI [Bacillus alveayuensis]|uniref:Sporulation integral membrane protein YtvI n=1 Tax=Aeribacillus alveayuensis TaxID=279215 RepID=A0ABT9VJF4_9BACI|nr:sporulation integral membrane protein YtvI [Bacillus alveayuensis]MDQ0161088.1 sporulation integral membrane protein YtvI [Bacillus alveayuensis]
MNLNYVYIFLRFFLVLAIIVGGGYLIYFISSVTYPFIIALILAFFMNPLVDFIENKIKIPRGLAVFFVMIILFASLSGLLSLLIAEIVSGSTYLAKVVPVHFTHLITYVETFIANQIIPLVNTITNMFHSLEANQQETILSNIQNVGEQIATSVGNFIKDFLEKIPTILGWLPNAASVIVFSLLATFFISKDWYKLKSIFSKLLPQKVKKSGYTVFKELQRALFGFMKAQLTLISITTVIVLIGLTILRVEYAITVALLIGLVDLLPYLGTGLVFVPWIIYLAFSGDLPLAISIGILYIVVLLQRQFMEPKVLSSSIGLDPLATLISLFVGFKLIGFLGLIIGPIVLVVIKTLHKAGVIHDIWNFIIAAK